MSSRSRSPNGLHHGQGSKTIEASRGWHTKLPSLSSNQSLTLTMNTTLVILFAIITVSFANILDFLGFDSEAEKRDDANNATLTNCNCEGPSCNCCVDFKIPYIDLGGPGCVRMNYLSQSEGIAINVSYGKSLLHSKKVNGPNPEPTCINLLTNVAQVCAQFSDLKPHNDGLRGCLLLEPRLLGDVTTNFNIGCFLMGPEGMRLEESSNLNYTAHVQSENGSDNEAESETEALNEEELIAAVNESAEQGLVFFGNLLGLSFGKAETNASNTEVVTPIANTSDKTPPSETRR